MSRVTQEQKTDRPATRTASQRSLWVRLVRGFAATILGLALVLVLVEVGVRLIDPFGISHFFNMRSYGAQLVVPDLKSERIFTHPENVNLDLIGWNVRTDSNGLRGPEREMPKPKGTRRLLYLGDSITFGWGISEEDTFVAMVERDLSRDGGVRLEGINGGHLFHDTTQEAAVLLDVGFDYEPDVVILVWCANDTGLTRTQWGKPKESNASPQAKPEIANVAARDAVLNYFRPALPHTVELIKFVDSRRRIQRHRETKSTTILDRSKLMPDLVAGWEACKLSISAMQAACVDQGAAFVVLATGGPPALEEFCLEAGVSYASIQLTPEQQLLGVRNSRSDPHMNRRGNRILADNVLKVLNELKLLDEDLESGPGERR